VTPLLIFDLDGTLINSQASIVGSIKYALAELGLTHFEVNEIKFCQQDLAASFHEMSAVARVSVDPLVLQSFIEHYRKHHSHEPALTMAPYEGVVDTLRELKRRQHLLAVATTKHTAQARHIVKELGLENFFDFVQGTDPGLRYKPEPDIIHAVMDRLQMSSGESSYIGDSAHDMKAARAAGVIAVGAAYGFSGREGLEEGEPHAWLECPTDLLDLADIRWKSWHFDRDVTRMSRVAARRLQQARTAAGLAVRKDFNAKT
jgi:HAD superfamily hydrolase (TIGR01549 family)